MDSFGVYLLTTIDSYKSRRALTLSFNEGKAGVIYADVLVYLTIEYLSQLKNNPELLASHDGFMVKTPKDAEIELGLSQDSIRLVYKGLEAAKIIEVKTKGQDNKTCLRVNLDVVNQRLEEFIPKFEAMKQEYFEKQEKTQAQRKEQSTKNLQRNLDFDKVNEVSINNNPKDLGDLSNDADTLTLIYIVNHYYKLYTGRTFIWNAVKFNTLMTTWQNRADRLGSEFGMSYAIFKELNNKGQGSQRFFELRVRETFNPDIRPSMFNSKEFEGVIFDNILKLNL